MTLLITQEGIFYDKEDLASNKTYLFYLSFKLNKKPRLYQHCILPSRKVITEPSNLSYVVMHQMSY